MTTYKGKEYSNIKLAALLDCSESTVSKYIREGFNGDQIEELLPTLKGARGNWRPKWTYRGQTYLLKEWSYLLEVRPGRLSEHACWLRRRHKDMGVSESHYHTLHKFYEELQAKPETNE